MNTDVPADVARSAKGALVAPPVVASMVVYQPGPWFVESLQALAEQTYPQLQTLFFCCDGKDGTSSLYTYFIVANIILFSYKQSLYVSYE